MSEVSVQDILLAAVGAAGAAGTPETWHRDIYRYSSEIALLLNEHSPVAQHVDHILNSPVIVGDFKGIKFNDNSKRYRIIYHADRSNREKCCDDCQAIGAGIEHVWSERGDTPLGGYQHALLKSLRVGDRVRIWKRTEDIQGKDMKVRTLVHIESISERGGPSDNVQTESHASPQPANPPAGVSTEDSAPRSIPAGEPTTSKVPGPDVESAFERLTGHERVQLAQRCRDVKVFGDLAHPTSEDDARQILIIIESIVAMRQGI